MHVRLHSQASTSAQATVWWPGTDVQQVVGSWLVYEEQLALPLPKWQVATMRDS